MGIESISAGGSGAISSVGTLIATVGDAVLAGIQSWLQWKALGTQRDKIENDHDIQIRMIDLQTTIAEKEANYKIEV